MNSDLGRTDLPVPGGVFGDYCAGRHREVEGWLEPGFLTALAGITDFLRVAGRPPTFAEIGVHHGRFYVAIALALGLGARGVAIDIFEDQHLNPDGSGKGDRAAFLANLERFGVGVDRQTVIARDSRKVTPGEIRAALGDRGAMIFSVDGAHTTEYTRADLNLAAASIDPGGVVIVDDLFNPRWPGVIEGVLAWLKDEGAGYEMAVYGNNKGVIAGRDDARALRALFGDGQGRRLGRFVPLSFAGRPSLFASFGDPARIFDLAPPAFLGNAPGVIAFGRGAPGVAFLGAGWGTPERDGTWAIGQEAALRLPAAALRDGATVTLDVTAFVPPQLTQTLTIAADGREVVSRALPNGSSSLRLAVADLGPATGETIRLDLRMTALESPRSHDMGDDDRLLSVKLRAIRVGD